MTINTSGNVGIGTTISPAAKLGVDGGSSQAIFAVSLDRDGVIGQTWAAHTNSIAGVYGISKGEGGIGVIGEANKGNAYGVYGRSESASGVGVTGEANAANADGLYGKSDNGIGVYGRSASGRAMYAEGNAGQTRTGGGWAKAMAFVGEDGTIVRCYNSQLTGSAATTAPCGFSVKRPVIGRYFVDFGFVVNDRFVSITTKGFGYQLAATQYENPNDYSNIIGVQITYIGSGRNGDMTNAPFHIIVF